MFVCLEEETVPLEYLSYDFDTRKFFIIISGKKGIELCKIRFLYAMPQCIPETSRKEVPYKKSINISRDQILEYQSIFKDC